MYIYIYTIWYMIYNTSLHKNGWRFQLSIASWGERESQPWSSLLQRQRWPHRSQKRPFWGGKSMEIGKIWEKDGKIFNKWKNLGEIYGNLWKMCKKNRWEKYGKQWWETWWMRLRYLTSTWQQPWYLRFRHFARSHMSGGPWRWTSQLKRTAFKIVASWRRIVKGPARRCQTTEESCNKYHWDLVARPM